MSPGVQGYWTNVHNMTSYRLFGNSTFAGEAWSVDCNIFSLDGALQYNPGFCDGMDTHDNDTSPEGSWLFAQIGQASHDYGIALYSVVLADLGNAAPDNVLTKPDILEHYSSQFVTIAKQQLTPYVPAPPTNASYDELLKANAVGDLGITPSYISAQYFCQVPKLQSTGSLIVAILIADLVFLSAAWNVTSLVLAHWTTHTDSQAMFCAGCIALQQQLELPVRDLKSKVSDSKSFASRNEY
jgi:hypothetical protein